jgi:hypothetical protein
MKEFYTEQIQVFKNKDYKVIFKYQPITAIPLMLLLTACCTPITLT